MNFEASVKSMRCHEVCVGKKYALARSVRLLEWLKRRSLEVVRPCGTWMLLAAQAKKGVRLDKR